jgi:hypothetical protein
MGEQKPALIHSKFFPALQGSYFYTHVYAYCMCVRIARVRGGRAWLAEGGRGAVAGDGNGAVADRAYVLRHTRFFWHMRFSGT